MGMRSGGLVGRRASHRLAYFSAAAEGPVDDSLGGAGGPGGPPAPMLHHQAQVPSSVLTPDQALQLLDLDHGPPRLQRI